MHKTYGWTDDILSPYRFVSGQWHASSHSDDLFHASNMQLNGDKKRGSSVGVQHQEDRANKFYYYLHAGDHIGSF